MSGDETVHPVDLIRKKRDGGELSADEIGFLVTGAARQTIPEEQLASWLMAAFLRGLGVGEVNALTAAMRASGEQFDHAGLGRATVDKHSTGGVGDKTSFLVAPIAAAAGLAVPMISGRALGHTGGTLDKLESIPGYRTAISLAQARQILESCGATIMGQTRDLVPADRTLYALRDRTATVESPGLICASIMSKKLAASLNALVLDVKTGSGAFLKDIQSARFLAALMVETGEHSGTHTAALLTSMDQPLGRFAGNWVEIWESVDLLRNRRHPLNEDLRELSLLLAGWMIYLGDKAGSAEEGRALAEKKLLDRSALDIFVRMVAAQGGDTRVLVEPDRFHTPKFRRNFGAPTTGHITAMDCEKIGWAVQRLGAGRERAGDPVAAHAGLEMHAKLGSQVEAGQTICTLFTDEEELFAEPEALLASAIVIEERSTSPAFPPLVAEIITRENKNRFLDRPPHT